MAGSNDDEGDNEEDYMTESSDEEDMEYDTPPSTSSTCRSGKLTILILWPISRLPSSTRKS